MTVTVERAAVALLVSGNAGVVGFVGLRGLGLPVLPAALLVSLCAAAGAWWLARGMTPLIDGLRTRRPWLSAAWLLLGLAAFAQTTRLSSFMLDPVRSENSVFPGDTWYVEHSCLTAYSESARMADEGEPNIYKAEHYAERKIGSFNVDRYHYPPSFLLLPLAARAASGGDYLATRSLWFGLTALALMLAIGLVAWRLEPEARLRAIAAAPFLWCSFPVQFGLQISNVQILVVSIAVLAWVAFPRRSPVGGALLGLSIVSKIFPGILGVYLLSRRRWRDAAWTAGFGAGCCLLALAMVGTAPFLAFLDYELPRLSSGEAFSRPFSRPFAVAHNMAPFGLPLKLAQVGVAGMTVSTGRVVSMAYGVCVLALALWAARRPPGTRAEEASVWLALLSLGTLVSPFAPAGYVLVTLVWLVCIDGRLFRPAAAAVVWVITFAPFLLSREGDFVPRALAFLPAQACAIAIPALVLWRAGQRPTEDPPQRP